MVVAAALGLGIGVAGGVMLGGQLFKMVELNDYDYLDITADADDSVPEPYADGSIGADMRAILPYMAKWTMWPDFEQVRWINSVVAWLWPHLKKAIHKMAKEMVDPILADTTKQYPFLEAIAIDLLDLGTFPLKLGGVKVYDTRDDEVILETPIMWGSDAKLHVSVRVRAGPVSIFIPLKVSNITVKATARITVRPLVETLPCLGAISISLTEPPYVDCTLSAVNDMDIMALPFLHEAVCLVIKKVTEGICVYPNQIPVPLMPNSGLPKPPIGMLEIDLNKIEDLRGSSDLISQGDPYVKISAILLDDKGKIVKQGAEHKTEIRHNTKKPTYNEHFKILLDDIGDLHKVQFEVYDYDLMGTDNLMCVYYLELDDTSAQHKFLRVPQEPDGLVVSLQAPPAQNNGMLQGLASNAVKGVSRLATLRSAPKAGDSWGSMSMEVTYIPFFRPDFDPEEMEKNPAKVMEMMQVRAQPRVVNDDMKGVLVVNLMRCMDLPVLGSSCDSYVEIKLVDPDGKEPDIRRSEVVLNEPSPRYRQKFEFVAVSATSMMTVTVYQKKNALSVGNIMKFGQKSDPLLGKVRIAVKDIVKTQRLKDAFPLQEAEQGDVHMSLDWTAVEREDS